MSCSGYFETLLRQVEQQSFNNKVLPDIQREKDRLSKKLESLRVKGDFHKANQVQAKLEKLEKVTERTKQLLGLMKVYQGLGTGSVVGAKLVLVNGKPLRHIEIHSPNGFNWGYGGSGPADLAYAILYDLYGKIFADENYQHFKFCVIAKLPQGEPWKLTGQQIEAWKDGKEA